MPHEVSSIREPASTHHDMLTAHASCMVALKELTEIKKKKESKGA